MNLSRSREKEAPAEQAFTFPGAIPTKSKVRSTAATKWLDFGGEEIDNFEFTYDESEEKGIEGYMKQVKGGLLE